MKSTHKLAQFVLFGYGRDLLLDPFLSAEKLHIILPDVTFRQFLLEGYTLHASQESALNFETINLRSITCQITNLQSFQIHYVPDDV